jgi:hypothetical protein
MDGKQIFWYRGQRWRHCRGAGWNRENNPVIPTLEEYDDYPEKNPFPGPTIDEVEEEIKRLDEEETILQYELNEIQKRKIKLTQMSTPR